MTPEAPFNPFAQRKRVLELKRAAITQICSALEEYFTADLDAEIEGLNRPMMAFPAPASPGRWQPTQEDFIAACEKVSGLERAIEETRQAYSRLSEDGPEGAVRASLGFQLSIAEDSLESAKRSRDAMQKAMEESGVPE
jgi:hypothetical protein